MAGTTRKRKSATKAKSTWGVKGVSIEARTAAKRAAKRDGVFLGQWVDRVLLEAAQKTLQPPQPPPPTSEEILLALVEQVGRLDDRLSKMTEEQQKGLFSGVFKSRKFATDA